MQTQSAYQLIDSGDGKKLESFGGRILERPCAQAVWKPRLGAEAWKRADASFTRDGGNRWTGRERLPESWTVESAGLVFKIQPTDFGHLGFFPEHAALCEWIERRLESAKRRLGRPPQFLNLFAYSGGAGLAAARAGAQVCHVDASKGMVAWARENAGLNKLDKAPIRWIVDDALKFVKRELRRESRYEGILLDPPSFGRGAKGELFKVEDSIGPLLDACRGLFSGDADFLVLSCHTPGFTPQVMKHLITQGLEAAEFFAAGKVEAGELMLEAGTPDSTPPAFDVPSGTYARWRRDG